MHVDQHSLANHITSDCWGMNNMNVTRDLLLKNAYWEEMVFFVPAGDVVRAFISHKEKDALFVNLDVGLSSVDIVFESITMAPVNQAVRVHLVVRGLVPIDLK